MTRLNQDFEMHQAENKTLRVPIVDADGDPQTLTGATVRWEVFRGTTSILTKTSSDGSNPITLYNAAGTNDGVSIPIVPADTTGLTPREYSHECRATLAGVQLVLFSGKLTLKYSETKA